MAAIGKERRQRRSNDTRTALSYQLDYVRDEASLEAIVLADGMGLPLAASGDPQVCAELSALAPLAAHGHNFPFSSRFENSFVHVRKVSFDGIELFLASCSESIADVWSARIETWLAEAQHGVTRILAA